MRAYLGTASAHVVKDVVLGVVKLARDAKVQRHGRVDVEEVQHVKASQLCGVQDGLALKLVEVGRYGDHHVDDVHAGGLFGLLPRMIEQHADQFLHACVRRESFDTGQSASVADRARVRRSAEVPTSTSH